MNLNLSSIQSQLSWLNRLLKRRVVLLLAVRRASNYNNAIQLKIAQIFNVRSLLLRDSRLIWPHREVVWQPRRTPMRRRRPVNSRKISRFCRSVSIGAWSECSRTMRAVFSFRIKRLVMGQRCAKAQHSRAVTHFGSHRESSLMGLFWAVMWEVPLIWRN